MQRALRRQARSPTGICDLLVSIDRDSISSAPGELLIEPCARHVPVTRYCVFRNVQHARDLLIVETAKVSQLDHLTASFVHLRQTLKCFIQPEQLQTLIRSYSCSFFQRNLLRSAAALGVSVTPRMVDEYAPHYLRRDGEEVRTIGPMYVPLIYEADVSFVYEGGGLECVTFSLPAHVTSRKPAQFLVDQRIQLVECGLVPVAPLNEQLCDLMLVCYSCQSVAVANSCSKLSDLARFTEHLVYFSDVKLFFGNHAARVVFQQH
jgi:hypothetical protein